MDDTIVGQGEKNRFGSSHYYFEKYEILDGEGEYRMMFVRETQEPLTTDEWLREFVEFASANTGASWSEHRIKKWLADPERTLGIYCGTRIYRHFVLREISKSEYDVLNRFFE